jgi:hypothetical protein
VTVACEIDAQAKPELPMHKEPRHRSPRVHALRIDSTAIWQGGIAAMITFAVAWLVG